MVAIYQDINGKKIIKNIHIEDAKIATRLVEYTRDYYGNYETNCSTLARYLYSGNFEESSPDRLSMMFEEHVVPYRDQKIEVGDVLCTFYHHYHKFPKSRKSFFRKQYREALLAENVLVKNPDAKIILSPRRIIEIYGSGGVRDYDFMTCVAIHKRERVFVGQMGRHVPSNGSDLSLLPILFNFGAVKIPGEVPAATFIRKRRK